MQTGVAVAEQRAPDADVRLAARRPGVLRAAALLALLVTAVYVYGRKLDAVGWTDDEVGYRNAGVAYLRGSFELNTEHPFLVKYLYGAAQLVAGDGSPTAVRVVSAAAAVLTTFALVALVRRAAGWGAGLLAGALWVLLPHPVQLGVRDAQIAPKLERIASLEAVMVLFVTLALYCTWRWLDGGGWRDALLAGAAVGLAGGSKASAAFAVPALVLVAAYVALRQSRWRQLLPQAVAAVGVAALVLVLTYLPDLTSMPDHVRSVLANAAEQSARGHAVILDGELYKTAPWWSLAYWQWAGQGSVVTAGLVAASVVAVFGRRLPRTLVALLLLSVAIPFLWLSLVNGFLLSHYAALYQAPLAALSALAVASLARGSRVARGAAVALAVSLLGFGGAKTVGYVADLEPTGYAALNDAQDLVPSGGAVAVSGSAFVSSAYFPQAAVTGGPKPGADYDAVVVDRRLPVSPAVAVLLGEGGWRVAGDGKDVRLYVRGIGADAAAFAPT